jgi:hypothetical protein
VFITSTVDSNGIFVTLSETADGSGAFNTGVFTGTFGFTAGTSSSAGPLPVIRVDVSSSVTVAYFDANPRGTRTASAVWKKVFPFEDTWIIDDFSCFIATAAYGSALSPEVRVFRRFRDEFLLRSRAGRVIVACYYRVSPPLAAVIADHPVLRSAARCVLAPVSGVAGFAVGAGRVEKLTVSLLLALAAAFLLVRVGSARTRDKDRAAERS